MDLLTIRFRLKQIKRNVKGLINNILGRDSIKANPVTVEDLMHSTAAWHHTDPGHPSELCRCEGDNHDADCQWKAVMCRTCDGDGMCHNCRGDGIDPLLEQRPS